ncbi:ATP-binding protein [Methylophaga nitratireducenticrescens]|uniref:Uncharacterized protein n=1 Tax=Methylophaga nitratireducenticrescens TaxID=754476 RepID=I1XGQ3_METNJ|nr:ATP-binding protein [Methylophaga nitratireducenticrescens]AFI83572.1 ATP-binding protein [Methylophaga nitratireducenticrescens]
MQEDIERILTETPGLRGRQIAKKLGVDKKVVNSYLSKQKGEFVKDEDHCWYVAGAELQIKLNGDTWVNGLSFDNAIKRVGSPLEPGCKSVHFILPEGCRILLEAAARLLAISNQAALAGKDVIIDFSDCSSTLTYFDRMGFFDLLNPMISVKPDKPRTSRASIYHGNSESVYEFGEIDPHDLDENIPKRLKESFVHYAGVEYSQPAFTVLSELFGNVRDHSDSPIPGYIALQRYKGHDGRNPVAPHIQTIVSDSGRGITGTLMPILEKKYPDIYRKFDFSDPSSKPLLIKEVIEKGQISRVEDDGHGLGLKRSGDVAASYNATISVREDTFELKLSYKVGRLASTSYELDLPKMLGCHICFDFILATR